MLSWMLLMPKRTPSSGHRKPRWRVARRGSVNHASIVAVQVQYCREHRDRPKGSMQPMVTIESRRAVAERSHRKGGTCSVQETAHMRPRHDHYALCEDASLSTIQAWGLIATHVAASQYCYCYGEWPTQPRTVQASCATRGFGFFWSRFSTSGGTGCSGSDWHKCSRGSFSFRHVKMKGKV